MLKVRCFPYLWLRLCCGAILALAVLALTGCSRSASPKPSDVSIYFTCDTHGRLVPCGCFTGQYGGMTRLKTMLDAETITNALRLDVGDAIGGNEDYDVIEYRYLLRAYAALNYDALNLGQRETQLSAAQLRDLKKTGAPLLSANLLDKATGQPLLDAYRVFPRDGWKIGVIGVVDTRGLDESLGAGLAVEKMESTLSRLLPEVRAKADIIVLLAFTDEETLTKLAEEFYELDVILGGKVRQPSQELQKANRSVIYFTTNEGRTLGSLTLRVKGRSKLTVRDNEIRLLVDKIPEDASFQKLAQDYRDEVRRTKLAVDDPRRLQVNMVPGVRTVASYAGTQSCLECHPSAANVWQKSGHAHAFQTLLAKKADADPKCIGCHTIGFATLSGYQREFAGAKLTDVGCESCHGPGSLHVKERKAVPPGQIAEVNFKFRPLAAGDCRKCHYGEFSRPFDWDKFWQEIKHGKEVTPIIAKSL
jgi:hypothetical protein